MAGGEDKRSWLSDLTHMQSDSPISKYPFQAKAQSKTAKPRKGDQKIQAVFYQVGSFYTNT